MRRLIGIPLAAGLLILAATAVLAGTDAVNSATQGGTAVAGRAIRVLEDVLSGLVDDGTITQEQSDAIVSAVEDRAEELRAQFKEQREQLREFLEDGVISADELAQLPEDHPLRNVDESLLEDGQLTRDELRELRVGRGRGHHGFGPGHRLFGPGFERRDEAPDAGSDELSPEPSEAPAASS